MSEYVRKQALVEWLEEAIQRLRGLEIGFRNDGDEIGARDCRHDVNTLHGVKAKIQSGAFDAPEMEHINAYWAREGLIKHQQEEIQRLRAAINEMRDAIWGEYVPIKVVTKINKIASEALSTATEPTGPYTIRRDEYGHAVAIERNGYTVLHLQPGTERNEQEVEGIVALLNMNAAKVERVREGDGNE